PQSRLRREIRASRAPGSPPIRIAITVKVCTEREQRWKAAAEAASMPLPEWSGRTLDQAARDAATPERSVDVGRAGLALERGAGPEVLLAPAERHEPPALVAAHGAERPSEQPQH